MPIFRMAGLDASIALNVMQALKDIAASGKTVIVSFLCYEGGISRPDLQIQVTVHQPRSDIWQAIDNLLLLSGSGTMVVSNPSLPFVCLES
jgi:hypothetical protein